MLTIDKIKEAVTKVGKKYGIKKAYLFGSYARGEATEKSDVDVIMERGEIKTYDAYFDAHEDLESELGKKVDLLATDGVRPKVYEQISRDWILLYGA